MRSGSYRHYAGGHERAQGASAWISSSTRCARLLSPSRCRRARGTSEASVCLPSARGRILAHRGDELLLEDEAALFVFLVLLEGNLVLPTHTLLADHAIQAPDSVEASGHHAVLQWACSDVDHLIEEQRIACAPSEVGRKQILVLCEVRFAPGALIDGIVLAVEALEEASHGAPAGAQLKESRRLRRIPATCVGVGNALLGDRPALYLQRRRANTA
mmetsp:Transcript_31499/g.70973  ORF Transcript_31499/g.70973 Transcript_31499/m.70973 type:complete len:216 (+) Transcript_31499:40-687(+)